MEQKEIWVFIPYNFFTYSELNLFFPLFRFGFRNKFNLILFCVLRFFIPIVEALLFLINFMWSSFFANQFIFDSFSFILLASYLRMKILSTMTRKDLRILMIFHKQKRVKMLKISYHVSRIFVQVPECCIFSIHPTCDTAFHYANQKPLRNSEMFQLFNAFEMLQFIFVYQKHERKEILLFGHFQPFGMESYYFISKTTSKYNELTFCNHSLKELLISQPFILLTLLITIISHSSYCLYLTKVIKKCRACWKNEV
jgi:hypothetical protein